MGASKHSVPSQVAVDRALNTLLERMWWPQTLQPQQAHSRVHDDCDGDRSQTLTVYLGHDLDAHVMVDGSNLSLRFRAPLGGGASPRVRNALLVLAEAIRRDNEERPRHNLAAPAGDN